MINVDTVHDLVWAVVPGIQIRAAWLLVAALIVGGMAGLMRDK